MAVPEILVAFIAAPVIIARVSVMYVGHMIRKSEIESENFESYFYEDGLYSVRFKRELFFRKADHRF